MAKRGNPKTRDNRSSDGRRAINEELAEIARPDGHDDNVYVSARETLDPEGHARTQRQIDNDRLWPDTPNTSVDWDKAALAVEHQAVAVANEAGLAAANEAGLLEVIARKKRGGPNDAGSQQEKRDFDKVSVNKGRHILRKKAVTRDLKMGE